MTNKEKIIERLKLLNKMREGGEDGERANAAALMEEIMRKHGISEEDLEVEKEELLWYNVPDSLHFKLFLQMMSLVSGENGVRIAYLPDQPQKRQKFIRKELKCMVPKGEEYNIVAIVKKSVFAESCARYLMYKDDFEKKSDRFFYAYLHANSLLLVRDSGEPEEIDEEQKEELLKSIMMSRQIERANVLRQLEGGAK